MNEVHRNMVVELSSLSDSYSKVCGMVDELEEQVERLELANVGFKESQDRMKNHLGDLVRSKVAHEGRTLFTLMAMLGCAKMTTKEARASGAFQTDTEFSRGVKALQGAGLAKKTRLNVVELEE